MSRARKARALRKAARFIAPFEGFRSCPYRDAVGVWTVGYGHTSGVGPRTPCLSERKGRRLMREDARPVMDAALRSTRLRLRVNELAALISFGFNLGPGYFERGHTIGDALHRGDRRAIAEAFLLYDKAGGRTLAGLTRRRRAERRLFLKRRRKK